MQKDYYRNLEEWKKDFVLYKSNPNDKHLVQAIDRRANNSSSKVKKEIDTFLKNELLEMNPFLAFKQATEEAGEEHWLKINSVESPWFEV